LSQAAAACSSSSSSWLASRNEQLAADLEEREAQLGNDRRAPSALAVATSKIPRAGRGVVLEPRVDHRQLVRRSLAAVEATQSSRRCCAVDQREGRGSMRDRQWKAGQSGS
jgi:hypothetical protein